MDAKVLSDTSKEFVEITVKVLPEEVEDFQNFLTDISETDNISLQSVYCCEIEITDNSEPYHSRRRYRNVNASSKGSANIKCMSLAMGYKDVTNSVACAVGDRDRPCTL